MGRDEYAWQETFLAQRYKPVNNNTFFIDKLIVAISVIGLVGIVLGSIYGFL
jgi:hypothetical protein